MKGNSQVNEFKKNPMDMLVLRQLGDLQTDIICLSETNLNWKSKKIWTQWAETVKKYGKELDYFAPLERMGILQ